MHGGDVEDDVVLANDKLHGIDLEDLDAGGSHACEELEEARGVGVFFGGQGVRLGGWDPALWQGSSAVVPLAPQRLGGGFSEGLLEDAVFDEEANGLLTLHPAEEDDAGICIGRR